MYIQTLIPQFWRMVKRKASSMPRDPKLLGRSRVRFRITHQAMARGHGTVQGSVRKCAGLVPMKKVTCLCFINIR